jgi:hypothetical protein
VFHRSDLVVRPLVGNRCGHGAAPLSDSLDAAQEGSLCGLCQGGLHITARPASLCVHRYQTLQSATTHNYLPIVRENCRRIEHVRDSPWTAEQLPEGVTEALREQLRAASAPPNSAFCDLIERSRLTLSGSASSQVKANLLAFLEPLCTNDHSADVLINTPLTAAIVQNLSPSSSSALKAQAAYSLGLLVRYAKYIDMAFASPGALLHCVRTSPSPCGH